MTLPHRLISRLFINGIEQNKLINVHSTIAGTAYLTDNYIASVINAHLDEKLGDMSTLRQASTFDLCSKLNIARDLLNLVLTKYEHENGWTVTNDIVLTSARQDDIIADIDRDIAANGYLSVIVKAQAIGLPYQFVQKLADSGIADGRIHTSGTLNSPGLLMSDEYVNKQRECLMKIILETTEPLHVQKIQRDTDMPASLFYDLFEHIVKVEDTNGFVRGRRENATFVPNVYRDDQVSKIRQFVESNDYIDYQRLNSYHLYNVAAKELLVNQFPDIQLLDTCAVTANVQLIVRAEIDEILGIDHWINVASLVPPIMTPTDISMLIETIADEKNDLRLVRLGQTFVTTNAWLKRAYEPLRQAMQLKSLGAKAEMNTVQKKQKQKRGRQASQDQDELSEDELLQALLKCKDLKVDPELAELVVANLFSRAKREHANMVQSVYLPTSQQKSEERVNHQLQKLSSYLGEFWCRFQLLLKATAMFDDSSIQSSLSKHLLRTLGTELVDSIITYHAYVDQRKTFVPAFDQGVDVSWKISLEDHQRDELLEGMRVEDQAHAFKARTIAIAGKPIEEFVKLVGNLLVSCGRDNTVTETDQTQCLTQNAGNLIQQLTGTNNNITATAPLILHLTILIYFQALYKLPLYASGKFVPKLIRQIAPRLRSDGRPEEADTIERCQHAILRALSANNVYTDEETALVKSTKELGIRVAKELV